MPRSSSASAEARSMAAAIRLRWLRDSSSPAPAGPGGSARSAPPEPAFTSGGRPPAEAPRTAGARQPPRPGPPPEASTHVGCGPAAPPPPPLPPPTTGRQPGRGQAGNVHHRRREIPQAPAAAPAIEPQRPRRPRPHTLPCRSDRSEAKWRNLGGGRLESELVPANSEDQLKPEHEPDGRRQTPVPPEASL